MKIIRIGTRSSPLALWQANKVKDELSIHWSALEIELVLIETTGDKILNKPLIDIGSKALFTKEIEDALLDDRIDIAVHSMKDLPALLPEGLKIGAVLKRGPGGDVLISKHNIAFSEIPSGATIATGSLRRRAQLLHARPDLKTEDLRGNVETRLNKLEQSEWAGIILAEAGIVRLGFEEKITERLPLPIMLPPVGQGAVAVELRADDSEVQSIVKPIADADTTLCVAAERAFLHRLEGGCQVPIAARADIVNSRLVLEALISDLEGKQYFRGTMNGSQDEPTSIGQHLAERLLEDGAEAIVAALREFSEHEL